MDIAEAVKEALNGHSFSMPFTAQRAYRPSFELPEMKTLHVTVVPHGVEITTAGRAIIQDDVAIDVAVQKKFDTDEPAELDGLMALVEEIGEFLRSQRPADAAWVKTENAPIYSAEHMEQYRQFTSVLTVTYRVLE